MENALTEWAGFACLVGFAYFVWPPAALLVAGLVLLLVANVRAARRRDPNAPPAGRAGRQGVAAYRDAETGVVR
jgi:hypothetical protein